MTWLAALDINGLPQQLTNGIVVGAIYALIALGYTMVYGVLKLINFAHGEVFMIGCFVSLFVSWSLGYTGSSIPTATNPTALIWMILASMLVCGLVGVFLERFAYRPMRGQPRINSLITAIGISLFLQYGLSLVFPISPPRTITEQVNPYWQNSVSVTLRSAPQELVSDRAKVVTELKSAVNAQNARMKELGIDSTFRLPEADKYLVTSVRELEAKERELGAKVNSSETRITVPTGKMIMLIATLALMLLLRWVVMGTAVGRQMRAVSHDFDSASLMGIDVNFVVSMTFFIGSALAGAGGMMAATFQGVALTAFVGLEYGVKAFVAAVLGGIGNIPGAVLGGLLIGMLESIATAFGQSAYQNIVTFFILILVLIVKPAGLLGSAKAEKV